MVHTLLASIHIHSLVAFSVQYMFRSKEIDARKCRVVYTKQVQSSTSYLRVGKEELRIDLNRMSIPVLSPVMSEYNY